VTWQPLAAFALESALIVSTFGKESKSDAIIAVV